MSVCMYVCLYARRMGPNPFAAAGWDRAENVFADREARVVAPVEGGATDFIQHNVLIKWFSEVNSPHNIVILLFTFTNSGRYVDDFVG